MLIVDHIAKLSLNSTSTSTNNFFEKNFGSKKILGPKKLESEKYFESKLLVPPPPSYGIGLSMVGWIGVPFLGFKVAYIPNLSLLQSLEPFEKGSKI